MENNSSRTSRGKTASSFEADLGGLADHVGEAADAIGTHAADAFDEVKSAGQGFVDDSVRMASRSRKRISKAVGQLSDYADENTMVIAAGALMLGLLLGHVMTRGRG